MELIFDLLPEDLINTDSPIRLDINFKKEVRRGEDVSFGLKRQNRDECLFIARSSEQTLCSASVALRS